MAAALERFQFEDRIYYRQYRKCNRPQCKCQSGQPAHMHGPYWYARFEYSKGARYIGKSLPQHVSQARERYKQLAASSNRPPTISSGSRTYSNSSNAALWQPKMKLFSNSAAT